MTNQKYPKHDRKYFFKYTSAKTAKLILQNKNLKYSSPMVLNDPFDVQTEILFNFKIDSLPELILDEIEAIVLQKKAVHLNPDDEWSKAILLFKNKAENNGYSRAIAKKTFLPFLNILMKTIKKTKEDYNHTWQTDILPRMRVLSLSEERDNILMWSHYAKEEGGKGHTGIVFKLAVLPNEYNNEGNSLCIASPMRYKKEPPSFYQHKDWIEEIIGIKTINLEQLYFEYAFTKNIIWKYEKEWRVWDLQPKIEKELYSFYPIKAKEISEVYFGINVKEDDKKDIIDLAKEFNPDIQFYKAKKALGGYKIDFSGI